MSSPASQVASNVSRKPHLSMISDSSSLYQNENNVDIMSNKPTLQRLTPQDFAENKRRTLTLAPEGAAAPPQSIQGLKNMELEKAVGRGIKEEEDDEKSSQNCIIVALVCCCAMFFVLLICIAAYIAVSNSSSNEALLGSEEQTPTFMPTIRVPTTSPTTSEPTESPTPFPTSSPTTSQPTTSPTDFPTISPTSSPTTELELVTSICGDTRQRTRTAMCVTSSLWAQCEVDGTLIGYKTCAIGDVCPCGQFERLSISDPCVLEAYQDTSDLTCLTD